MGLAKQLLIPKVGPLLLAQLFAYGIILLIAMGIFWTQWAKPGLAAYGWEITTTADRVASQGNELKEHQAKIACLERRLGNIETGVRILVAEVDPERAAILFPPMEVSRVPLRP